MQFIDNLKDDIGYLTSALRTLKGTTPIARNPTRVLPVVMQELAQRFGDAPALLGEREQFSYRELGERQNRYSRWALGQGIAKGDTICLLMPNRPEYVAIWLGVTQVGGVVSLLNTNLVGQPLAHCIDIVRPKHIIVAAECMDTFATARPLLASSPQVWLHGDGAKEFPRLDRNIDNLPGEALADAERRPLGIDDHGLYIYTSGTTGLPKAANINHYRMMLASYGFAGAMDTRPGDRMYDCLPLYHTSGGVVAIGSLLVNGGSVFIREKFSAREFWDDVVRHDCTLFQYIGELCRYLVNSPRSANETRHRIRLACGNGLRPDVWPDFQQRFRVPKIVEFYGATEGNCSMFNFAGKEGAVGRVPWFVAHRFPMKVVRFDVETEQPVRGADGFCIECAPDEAGEVIGKIINDPEQPANRFEGYADAQATRRKVLHDAFEKGDAWFRTGDLMRKDARGYFYFVDRIGDTFRWKGENVSTAQVAEIISGFPGVLEASVYGVAVPGQEGRAGMAALSLDGDIDLAAFRRHLAEHLPVFARPVFLRLGGPIEVTPTFKQKKFNLVAQGFDPARTRDPVYLDDPERRAFVRVDPELYGRLQAGQVRL